MTENKKPIFLSIIIPSFNEKKNLSLGVLEKVATYLAKQKYSYEIILSDDGSTDGSLEVLAAFVKKHPHFRLLANQHAGKGPTVTAGMLAARGQWRLFTDFDQSTPLSEIEKLLPSTVDHQIVIGSRAAAGAKREKEPWYRHVMGFGFNILTRIIILPGILDSQCGFKLFSKRATEKIFPRLHIYGSRSRARDAFTGAFDVELLFLARKNKFTIAEIPVLWQHAHSDRVSPVKDSVRMLRDIIRIRLASWRGQYEK